MNIPKIEIEPAPGTVIAIGTDIVQCERIASMIQRHGDTFLQRTYTSREIAYCSARRSANLHYAGRWAAKEAVLKALGTGWSGGIKWTDVEVVNAASGSPSILLANIALERSAKLHIAKMLISISHCESHAIAFVTAVA